MTVEIIDCVQGEDAWFRARAGVPTASEFSSVLAKGEGKTRASYMRRLAGEILTGEPLESFSNGAMERGKLMEAEARREYELMTGATCQSVGFVRNGRLGCSPDSLIGANGALEIKTMRPDLMIDVLLKDEFPTAHKAQCQGVLLVCEREWIDQQVYWKGMPFFVKRAYRDVQYLANLRAELSRFCEDLDSLVGRIRRMG